MQRNARIESIEQTKKELASVEEKLFFFDKMDSYEMEKVEKHQAWAKSLPRTGWNMVRDVILKTKSILSIRVTGYSPKMTQHFFLQARYSK